MYTDPTYVCRNALMALGIFTEQGVAVKDKNFKVTYVFYSNMQEKDPATSNPRC